MAMQMQMQMQNTTLARSLLPQCERTKREAKVAACLLACLLASKKQWPYQLRCWDSPKPEQGLAAHSLP